MTTRQCALPIAALLLAFSAGLPACDTVKAPGSAQPDPLPPVMYPKIEAAEGLSGFLKFDEPKITSESPLGVSVPIRAATDFEDLNVQYRFIFFDVKGVPIDPDRPWKYTKLASRRQEFLMGNALDSNAKDWRLQIRPAR
jgi:hypothetical protein